MSERGFVAPRLDVVIARPRETVGSDLIWTAIDAGYRLGLPTAGIR